MGKFSRNREYSFVSLEEMISDITKEFKDGNDITIALPWDETGRLIKALISTEQFTPYSIHFDYPDVDNYSSEYYISLTHIDDNYLFVEPAYNTDENRYLDDDSSFTDIMFISAGVSTTLYDKLIEDGHNTVLFDIEE